MRLQLLVKTRARIKNPAPVYGTKPKEMGRLTLIEQHLFQRDQNISCQRIEPRLAGVADNGINDAFPICGDDPAELCEYTPSCAR
jgi:hypothetical protein